MSVKMRHSASTFLRIALFTSFFVGPVGAYAYAKVGDRSASMSGAGLLIVVSLQRKDH